MFAYNFGTCARPFYWFTSILRDHFHSSRSIKWMGFSVCGLWVARSLHLHDKVVGRCVRGFDSLMCVLCLHHTYTHTHKHHPATFHVFDSEGLHPWLAPHTITISTACLLVPHNNLCVHRAHTYYDNYILRIASQSLCMYVCVCVCPLQFPLIFDNSIDSELNGYIIKLYVLLTSMWISDDQRAVLCTVCVLNMHVTLFSFWYLLSEQ